MVDDWLNIHDKGKRSAALKVAKEDSRVRVIEHRSLTAAQMFRDSEIDFVYIDAVHDFDNVISDMRAWWAKCRLVMGGHDYVPWNGCHNSPMGVIPAVEQFSAVRRLKVIIDGQSLNVPQRLKLAYDRVVSEPHNPDAYPSWYLLKG